MATLQGQEIKDTYQALLKTDGNTTASADLQTITDGLGNTTALSLSTEQLFVSGGLIISTTDNIIYNNFYDPTDVVTLPWSYIYLEMGNPSNSIEFDTIVSQTSNTVTIPGDVSSVTIAPVTLFYGDGTSLAGYLINLDTYPGAYPYYYNDLQVTDVTYNVGTNQSTVTFAGNFLSTYPTGYEPFATASSSVYSLSNGLLNQAIGQSSHAEGVQATSVGNGSHAEGYVTTAVGYTSHAEGSDTTSVGDYSHAEGRITAAIGQFSHAEGQQTTAIGQYSHAEGQQTTATGVASHAEGRLSKAKGTYSHAEGYFAISSGSYSHAEGTLTIASGSYSHAEGSGSLAIGLASHAEGDRTEAVGDYSHAEGKYSIAAGEYSHAEGYATEAIGANSHAEGYVCAAYGIDSHAEGRQSYIASVVESGHGEGYATYVSASYSHAEGFRTTTRGLGSHAEGAYTTALGSLSNDGTGIPQHAEGRYNVPDATSLLIVGNGTADNARANAFTITTFGTSNATASAVFPSVASNLNFTNDTAAAAAGVPIGGLYRSGSFILIRTV